MSFFDTAKVGKYSELPNIRRKKISPHSCFSLCDYIKVPFPSGNIIPFLRVTEKTVAKDVGRVNRLS